MITFLTVSYIVLLAILIKVGVVKPTQLVKLSPIAWIFLLVVLLFVPMQFGAPSGDLRVYQNVIQIVSQVSGRVVEVPVQANVPVRRGDVLFRVDRRPYQFQVDKLEAVVADAGVNVAQLAERVSAANAMVDQAQANFLASQTDFERRAEEAVQQAEAVVMQVSANLGVARANFARFDRAAQADAVSRRQLDASRREAESLEAQLLQSEAALQQARLTYEAGGDRLTAVCEQVAQAEAQARETRLAYEAQIEGVNPRVRQTLADLELARFNLDQTTVRAPADGCVVNLQLRPGSFVSGLAFNTVMSFVEDREKIPAALIHQNYVRHIRPGQQAEIVIDAHPGRIFAASVVAVLPASQQGQLAPSGMLPRVVPDPRLSLAVQRRFTPNPEPPLTSSEKSCCEWKPLSTTSSRRSQLNRGYPTPPEPPQDLFFRSRHADRLIRIRTPAGRGLPQGQPRLR